MTFTRADKMCYGKRHYPSQIKAYCEIGVIKAKYADAAQDNFRAYECPIGRGWHITRKAYEDPEMQKLRWMAGQNVRVCT